MRKVSEIVNILSLCIVIFFVSVFFIYKSSLIGIVLMGLGIICLATLLPFGIPLRSTVPDVIFGLIDNGILAAMAVFGGEFAGVVGAVIGGVVGNAITDGIAGIFEGYWAERFEAGPRTVLGSAVGKMAGCLLGAGAVLFLSRVI